MYFSKEDKNSLQKKTLSDIDSVFFLFLELNDTQDSFDIHDNVIKAIRKYYGYFNETHVDLIQIIIERFLGEAVVTGVSQVEDKKETKPNVMETSSKFSKVKI